MTAPGSQVSLTTQVYELPGVTPRLASAMASIGLTNVGKLLAHLPSRYEREEGERSIDRLEPETLVSTRGEVTSVRMRGFGRKTRFEAVLCDGRERLDLVWFNAPYMRGRLHPGVWVRVQGKCRSYNHGLQMANPTFRIVEDDEAKPIDGEEGQGRLVPVYPATEGATSREIGRVIASVLGAVDLIDDHLPDEYRKDRALPLLSASYRSIHAPESEELAGEAKRRLAYDELLLFQLAVFMKRAQLRGASLAPGLRSADALHERVLSMLPHAPTTAQSAVIDELRRDLTRDVPMNRLLQGDVGSGKTMVALYAMLLGVASEHQAALMAPTEILAEQHYRSISTVLEGSGVSVRLLTGSTPEGERHAMLERLAMGEIDLLIGTHALLTEHVRFKSLALAIIDEQHRFGVHQRAALREKATGEAGSALAEGLSITPHVLVMTATPIPRTMAMTLFGDLDISTIGELPPGRSPIETRVFGPEERAVVYRELRAQIESGERGYVVAPAIDSSEGEAGLMGVRELMAELESGPLSGRRLGLMHGRLARETRDAVMERFRAGQIDVLVATSVIEVGVDVPEATWIVIEQAERFGLSQLHQLRGRVGRGDKPGHCVLIGQSKTPEAEARLRALERSTDGFELAEQDFFLRGSGDLFGTKQSGATQFRVADLSTDTDLLKLARRDAQNWVETSPTLSQASEQVLRRRVFKAHGEAFGLGDVG